MSSAAAEELPQGLRRPAVLIGVPLLLGLGAAVWLLAHDTETRPA